MNQKSESEMALDAMKRAAETARQRAARFHSRLAIWRDGKVVLIDPNEWKAGQDGAVNPSASEVGKLDG